MTRLQEFSDQLTKLAPAGYYVALRVGFSFPSEEFNRLPEPWVEHYTRHSFVVYDPMMKWVYAHTGSARWNDMDIPDPMGVRGSALNHGLVYGAAASAHRPADQGRRSYGIFFRADRDFDATELAALESIITRLHTDQQKNQSLTAAEIEAVRHLSSGMRMKQIAALLGISESAVKARLNNAKRKLGAKTPSQAATIAAARRLL